MSAHSASNFFEATYGLPRWWILAINAFGVLIFPLFGLLLTLADTHYAAFRMLTHKLGVIGLPYTVSFLLAAVRAGILARDARRHREPRRVVWTYALLAAFCFFVAMEHISWGQAALHYHTPFGYGRFNKFGLFNLHNLPGLDEAHSIFLLVCGVAGLVSMRLWSVPRLRVVCVPPVLAPMVWAITIMATMEVLTDAVYVGFMFDMIVFTLRYAIEFVIGITCLVMVWLNGRLLRGSWNGGPAGVRARTP